MKPANTLLQPLIRASVFSFLKPIHIGTFLSNLSNKFDLSDENIYAVSRLLGSEVSKMTPAYFSKLCGTTGFLIFMIKDLLEHCGILIDRKVNNLRILKNLQYEEYKDKIYMDKINDFLEILKPKES